MPRPEVLFALRLVERFAAAEIPADVQDKLRLEVDCRGNSITLLECRPPWKPEFGPEWTRHGAARFKYNPTARLWTIYWSHRDLKFYRYEGIEPQEGIGPLIEEVKRDPHACFWG